MVKVFKYENYDASKHNYNFRRGFIIPISRNDVINVTTDNKQRLDHEKIADDFIALTDEEIKDVVSSMELNDENESKDMFETIKGFKIRYEKKKSDYPTSRKDFLIYEEDTIAYDSHSDFGQGSFIIFREEDKRQRFYVNPTTERIAYNYANNGWRVKYAPKDPKLGNEPEMF